MAPPKASCRAKGSPPLGERRSSRPPAIRYSNRLETYQRGDQRAAFVALDINPALRSVIRLGATAMPFRVGYTVSVIDDPLPLIGKHDLVPLAQNPFEDFELPSFEE